MAESMQGLKRSHRCTEVSSANIGEKVTVMGWVQKSRNKGGIIFVDLRDRSGILQVIFEESQCGAECFEKAGKLRSEFVAAIEGTVCKRAGAVNENLATGDIEVVASSLRILSEAETPPFPIEENSKTKEEIRLKYRYLDLRRPDLQRNLIMKSKVATIARQFMADEGFLEIETPMLTKSTPEGARDYLVPSRVHPGTFYALPQSPQLFKQLLMCSGYDRYFQIAKCFRDEDLRADRQPEFTQADMELSFVDIDDVIDVNERLLKFVFKEAIGVDVQIPLQRMPWQEAMDRFGSDKPDTRFGMEIQNVGGLFQNTDFTVFKNVLEQPKGMVGAIVAAQAADQFSRKEIDKLQEFVKIYGAKALAWLKMANGELSGSVAKVLKPEEKTALIETLELKDNDLIFLIADKAKVAQTALGALRIKLGRQLKLMDESQFNFLWVTNFPMFEYSEEEQRYVAAHHPFTSPNLEDVDKLMSDPENCYSRAYDLVLNGYELLSGSIRIHDQQVQEKVFEAIGMSMEEAREKFGFFIDAFRYGTPPHGGVGIGLERLVMILAGTDNIRDVVAFPKTASASDLMSEAPNTVDEKQLKELHIALEK